MKVRSIQFILPLLGALLILVNAIWIAIEGKVIVFSTYPANSVSELVGPWGRIIFGMTNLVSGGAAYGWLVLAIVNLVLVLMLHFRPRRAQLISFLVIVLSLASVGIGGGFIIGMLLAIIGSEPAAENKPLKETFLGKILRSLKLDSTLYESIKNNSEGLKFSAFTIIFLNILTGIGNGLYITCINKILDTTLPDSAPNILFRSILPTDINLAGIVGTYIGVGILKWFVFAVILYFTLTKIATKAVDFGTIAQIVALAYAPIALQIFMPLIFFTSPNLQLDFTWPLTMFFLTNIWIGFALVPAVRKTVDVNRIQGFGLTILASSIYYTINSVFIQPTFPLTVVWYAIQPIQFIEAMLTAGVILSLILGAFQRQEY